MWSWANDCTLAYEHPQLEKKVLYYSLFPPWEAKWIYGNPGSKNVKILKKWSRTNKKCSYFTVLRHRSYSAISLVFPTKTFFYRDRLELACYGEKGRYKIWRVGTLDNLHSKLKKSLGEISTDVLLGSCVHGKITRGCVLPQGYLAAVL